MLKILSLDSSTEMCSAALLVGAELLARQQLAPQKHAELLLPMIDELLAEAGLDLTQLDAIAFGQGPGSFMGLRIGVGVVQALAYGADKPVIAISSLQALAQAAFQQEACTHVLVGVDARMQAIYWGAYELDAHHLMQPIQADALAKPAEITFPNSQVFSAVGPAWEVYQDQCPLSFAKTYPKLYPLASAMLPLAVDKFQNQHVLSPFDAEPCYIRDQVTY